MLRLTEAKSRAYGWAVLRPGRELTGFRVELDLLIAGGTDGTATAVLNDSGEGCCFSGAGAPGASVPGTSTDEFGCRAECVANMGCTAYEFYPEEGGVCSLQTEIVAYSRPVATAFICATYCCAFEPFLFFMPNVLSSIFFAGWETFLWRLRGTPIG